MATVVQYEEFGGPEVLKLVDIPTPSAPRDGAVVEVKAAGVNPIDVKLRSGARASGPISEPRRIGSDAAGVIVEVGADVAAQAATGAGRRTSTSPESGPEAGHRSAATAWAVGDEVVVRGASGAYATHLTASAGQLVRKPPTVSWEVAAAIGVPVSTAYQVLRSLGVEAGMTLLIHGGSGSVGRAAVQFARLWGATVVATASEANHARLRELGAIPVAYGEGLADRIREVAPQGIDRVLDAIGSEEALDTSFQLVSDRSHIGTIVVGRRAAELGILAWSGGNPIPLSPAQQALRDEAYPVVLDLLARGDFEIDIARTFPLAEAAEAHRLSESGHPNGKIILLP